MRRLSFIIVIIGLVLLVSLLQFYPPKQVNSPEELSFLQPNQKVQTQGTVLSERTLYEKTNLLKLDNGIEITCNTCPSYLNKSIALAGLVEKYQNKTQISALRIISQK